MATPSVPHGTMIMLSEIQSNYCLRTMPFLMDGMCNHFNLTQQIQNYHSTRQIHLGLVMRSSLNGLLTLTPIPILQMKMNRQYFMMKTGAIRHKSIKKSGDDQYAFPHPYHTSIYTRCAPRLACVT